MKRLRGKMAIQNGTWAIAAAIPFIAVLAISCGTGGGNDAKSGPPGGFGAGKAGRGGGPNTLQAVSVRTTAVQRISIQRSVDLAGSLISNDQAKVSSEVAGVVRQVLVELGQDVAVGQVVAKLDPRELDLALQRARSQLRQTEAQLGIDGVRVFEPLPEEQISSVRMAIANRDDALAQLRRAQRLKGQNLLSQADLDTAQTRVKVTEANHQAALEAVQSLKATLEERRHAVELAQKKLNDTDIRSSVAGQVSERFVQQGEFIRENTPVVTIVQMNPLKVKTAIQERYAGIVRAGLTVEFTVESAPGQKFVGRVAHVSPSVDLATRTFPVEILVDNRNRQLKPGFFAKGVIFTQRDENAMAVPEDAVSALAGVSNVYVIENSKARQQTITLGSRVGDLYEVLKGLKGDEILAVSELNSLATGIPVKITQRGNSDRPNAMEKFPAGSEPTRNRRGGRP